MNNQLDGLRSLAAHAYNLRTDTRGVARIAAAITRLDFSVVKVAGKWKISDIVYKNMNGASLRKLLSQKVP
jgi:ABC-type transporter MlaC component